MILHYAYTILKERTASFNFYLGGCSREKIWSNDCFDLVSYMSRSGLKPDRVIWVTFCLGQTGLTCFIKYPGLTWITIQVSGSSRSVMLTLFQSWSRFSQCKHPDYHFFELVICMNCHVCSSQSIGANIKSTTAATPNPIDHLTGLLI